MRERANKCHDSCHNNFSSVMPLIWYRHFYEEGVYFGEEMCIRETEKGFRFIIYGHYFYPIGFHRFFKLGTFFFLSIMNVLVDSCRDTTEASR